MPPYVKVAATGQKGNALNDGHVANVRELRLPSGLGLRYDSGVKATLSTAMAGANNDIKLDAKYGGTWGNRISITLVDPAGNNQALAISTAYDAVAAGLDFNITASLATGGGGAITTTGAQLVTALNANLGIADLLTAANAAANDGTGVVIALAKTYLASGTNVGTGVRLEQAVSSTKPVVVDLADGNSSKRLKRNRHILVSLGEVT